MFSDIIHDSYNQCFDILTKKDISRDIYIGSIRVGINVNNPGATQPINTPISIEPYHTIILHSEIEISHTLPTDSSATLQRAVKVRNMFNSVKLHTFVIKSKFIKFNKF